MHPYYQPLAAIYEHNANPRNADWMKRYMKNQFEFYGIKTPDRTRLNRGFFGQYGLPEDKDLEPITSSLMQQPQREYHYFAISLAGKMKKQWKDDSWKLFEKMILSNSWWDTVDSLATNSCGQYFRKYPQHAFPVTSTWNKHDNKWLIRSSILFQLQYKNDTDEQLLFSYILPHIGSKEFFIQKAIGWALRQHARISPEAVMEFARNHELAPLSKREALKGIKDGKIV